MNCRIRSSFILRIANHFLGCLPTIRSASSADDHPVSSKTVKTGAERAKAEGILRWRCRQCWVRRPVPGCALPKRERSETAGHP